MRALFIVLAKLIGLLQIYWGLTYLSSIGLFMGQMARMESIEGGPYVIQILGILGFSVLCFGMAWLLLARTECIADKLKIQGDDQFASLSDDLVLRAGIKLVGVYILAQAIPELIKTIFEASAFGLWQGSLIPIWTQIVPAVLHVALGLLLAIRTGFILSLLGKGENVQGKRIIIGGFVFLAFVILLSRGLSQYPWVQHGFRYASDPVCTPISNSNAIIFKDDTNIPTGRDWYEKWYTKPYRQEQLATNEQEWHSINITNTFAIPPEAAPGASSRRQ